MSVEAVKKITSVEQVSTEETQNIYPKTEPYPNDSIELSTKLEEKKKITKKDKLKKWAIGFGGTVATIVAASFIIVHRKGVRLSKLYKEKLVLSNLPEKLNFKEAKTIEDAIKYAKEVLGIKEIDKRFTLEALNIANKGITDVSNANKGKLFIPKRLQYKESTGNNEKNYVAYVVRDISSKEFGDLVINKYYFDEKILNDRINNILFQTNGKPLYELDITTNRLKGYYKEGCVYPQVKGDLERLVRKFYKDKSSLNINEKQTLMYSLWNMSNEAGRTFRSPLETLKNISETKAGFLRDNNININFDEVEKMTTAKQVEFLKGIIKKFEKQGKYIDIYYDISLPTSTIHHEMGHLQDYAKNLKDLDLNQWKIKFSEIWENAKHKTKTGEDISRIGVEEVDNHWGSIHQDYYKKLFDEKPDKFKKLYPEFYEFLTNQEIQQTAGKVSGYAQSGIGEFIAETYADMIAGKKIPEDVMQLYRKYKGPELPQ